MKMPLPNSIIKVCGDHTTDVSALERLQVLAAAHEATASHDEQDQVPVSSCQCGCIFVPCMLPSDNEDVPVKVIQIGTDGTQTTRIAQNLGDN
jgi:hypothetical protein